jgi:hypothetical protein
MKTKKIQIPIYPDGCLVIPELVFTGCGTTGSSTVRLPVRLIDTIRK